MARKKAKATDAVFIEGTIQTVARIGIENMRTKHVAEHAGFSEATMYRSFPTKEILLNEAFLYVDKKISNFLIEDTHIQNLDNTPYELALYSVWRKVYRHLLDNKEEAIFLLRFRYSSCYTDEVRSKRQAYNGSFKHVYAALKRSAGITTPAYEGYIINYIFEMTLCYAEKIITGKIPDTNETEYGLWMAINGAVEALVRYQGGNKADDKQRTAASGQTGAAGASGSAGTGE